MDSDGVPQDAGAQEQRQLSQEELVSFIQELQRNIAQLSDEQQRERQLRNLEQQQAAAQIQELQHQRAVRENKNII